MSLLSGSIAESTFEKRAPDRCGFLCFQSLLHCPFKNPFFRVCKVCMPLFPALASQRQSDAMCSCVKIYQTLLLNLQEKDGKMAACPLLEHELFCSNHSSGVQRHLPRMHCTLRHYLWLSVHPPVHSSNYPWVGTLFSQ